MSEDGHAKSRMSTRGSVLMFPSEPGPLLRGGEMESGFVDIEAIFFTSNICSDFYLVLYFKA
jgi:hypothetical protein